MIAINVRTKAIKKCEHITLIYLFIVGTRNSQGYLIGNSATVETHVFLSLFMVVLKSSFFTISYSAISFTCDFGKDYIIIIKSV